MGQRDHRLYPTVYTLWHNPGLVPLLHTPGFVVEKLQGGADLMTPGLARGPPFPEGATKNSVVAVASLDRPSVPLFVGICEIDISGLEKVQGAKGHAVKGVHWAGDEIWAWSESGTAGGREAPQELEGWDVADVTEAVDHTRHGVQNLSMADGLGGGGDDDEDAEDVEDGGAPLQAGNTESSVQPPAQQPAVNQIDAAEVAEVVDEEPNFTTKEIDDIFHKAFLYSVYSAKQSGSPPHYGIELPLQPSKLISQLIQPYLPVHTPAQAQQLQIRKTSWKNTKKFIKHLEKDRICVSKDRNGGETVILDIDFNDHQVNEFVPYRLPKPKPAAEKTATITSTNGHASSTPSDTAVADPSINQKLTLLTVYRPSSKLVPDLFPSKSDYYTTSEITAHLKTYLSSSSDISPGSSSRFIKINPFIANNILTRQGQVSADNQALTSGEIARDVLSKRLLEDPQLLSPHWILLRHPQTWPLPPSSKTKPHANPPPKLHLTLEKRTGSKTVTRISNVSAFFIPAEPFAQDLQKKCASSTSVGQEVGGKPGMMEVMVQGDQRANVEKEVTTRRGVERKWIEIVDKTKKKGK